MVILEGEPAERRQGRPPVLYFYRNPRDEPSEDRKAEGLTGFHRYVCKMATRFW